MFHLRELRKAKSMKQSELAEKLGLSPSAIGMYEHGRRDPDNDTLVTISQIFDVTTDYLLGKTSDPHGYSVNKVSSIPATAEPANDFLNELFADRPDVCNLLKNGVYADKNGTLVKKNLSELPSTAKENLRNNILFILESTGYLPKK